MRSWNPLGLIARRTRARAVSETLPVATPFTHSRPGTGVAQLSDARSSAAPFARYAVRSHLLSSTGVSDVTLSMIVRSGENRLSISYAPQSPPVIHSIGGACDIAMSG